MKAAYSKRALDAIEDAPPAVRKAFFKQVALLVQDLSYHLCTRKSTMKAETSGKLV